jgi:hypothetical protein
MAVSTEPLVSAEPLKRLTRDLRLAARTLSDDEARFLVDAYYQMQDDRKRAANQRLSLTKSGEPHEVIDWLFANTETLEGDIRRALDAYGDSKVVGKWSKSIVGIGPVISAGLLAYIDIAKAPTSGNIWRFAGVDPTVKWEKGQKRPWNAGLKTLLWKVGESFVKVAEHEEDVYGKVILARKEYEWAKNLKGEYADQCAAGLARLRPEKDQEAKYWYSGCLTAEHVQIYWDTPATKRLGIIKTFAGKPGTGILMLPPGHIHARSKRYGVKLFIAHWHDVAWFVATGSLPVLPYVITHLGHVHFIEPPNAEMVDGLREAYRSRG